MQRFPCPPRWGLQLCGLVVFALGALLPPMGARAEDSPAKLAASQAAVAPRPLWLETSRRADRVVLVKSARMLHAFRGPLLVRSYRVALGFSPDGPKRVQGDGRTPEGAYTIDWRNPQSQYHRSLHISYPNARDRARARELGRSPGGAIMIHGLPGGQEDIGRDHVAADWTDGCIALTNEQVEDLWNLIDDGTPIHILP